MTQDTRSGPELPIPQRLPPVVTAPIDEVRDWYFTFGAGHFDQATGAPLVQRYVRIRGDYFSARRVMVDRFGARWAFQYATAEDAGVDQFGLAEFTIEGKLEPTHEERTPDETAS